MNESLHFWHTYLLPGIFKKCNDHVSRFHCILLHTTVTLSIWLVLLKCLVMRLGIFRNIFCTLGMEWLGEKNQFILKLNLRFIKEGCADQIRFIVPAPHLESCYKFDQFRWSHLLRPASRLHTGMFLKCVKFWWGTVFWMSLPVLQ